MKKKAFATVFILMFIIVFGFIVVDFYKSLRYEVNYALPQVRIEFPYDAAPLSKDYWIEKCKAEVVDADGIRRSATMDVNVKGRGNESFKTRSQLYPSFF